jgi:uncharacterized membrane protein YkvI
MLLGDGSHSLNTVQSTSVKRPWGVVTASVLTAVTGVAALVLAVLSAFGGHGTFSNSVAGMLGVYGALLLGAAWALWRLMLFSRGPVVATALLHLAVIPGYVTGHFFWVPLLLALVPIATIVGAVSPSTTRALEARRSRNEASSDSESVTGDDRQGE